MSEAPLWMTFTLLPATIPSGPELFTSAKGQFRLVSPSNHLR